MGKASAGLLQERLVLTRGSSGGSGWRRGEQEMGLEVQRVGAG